MDNIVYVGYTFKVEPLQPAVEILIAELGFAGFESFVENVDGVTAYIQKEDWHKDILETIQILNSNEFEITFSFEDIEQTNWNAEWEKNFKPIVVDDQCAIRAPFHDPFNVTYDIVIEPKMSFGTGHHETTHMMIQHLLRNDFKNKAVLDMGCGTGVLAILAAMKGASYIDAIDIDNWCYINSLENVERNNCSNIRVHEGDVSLLVDQEYDTILANINRNILLADLQHYVNHLNSKGSLFLSGFYDSDFDKIHSACSDLGLSLHAKLERHSWLSLHYFK